MPLKITHESGLYPLKWEDLSSGETYEDRDGYLIVVYSTNYQTGAGGHLRAIRIDPAMPLSDMGPVQYGPGESMTRFRPVVLDITVRSVGS